MHPAISLQGQVMKYLDQPGQEEMKKLIEVEFITPIYGLVGESSTWEEGRFRRFEGWDLRAEQYLFR